MTHLSRTCQTVTDSVERHRSTYRGRCPSGSPFVGWNVIVLYTDVPGFEHLYLEHSFVLDIKATPSHLDLRVEVGLLPDHPRYEPPRVDEVHCYGLGHVSSTSVRDLRWSEQGRKPASDRTGERERGPLELIDRGFGVWRVLGDWGDVEVSTSSLPVVVLAQGQVDLDLHTGLLRLFG